MGNADVSKEDAQATLADPREIRRLLYQMLVIPPLWMRVVGGLALVSCFSVDHPASGGVGVHFDVSTTTIGLVALIWLPALIGVIGVAGGRFKAAGIEASSGGLMGNSDELFRLSAATRSDAEGVNPAQPPIQSWRRLPSGSTTSLNGSVPRRSAQMPLAGWPPTTTTYACGLVLVTTGPFA